MNFKEVFRKNVTYDKIECHKKLALHPVYGKYILGKKHKKEGIKFTLCSPFGLKAFHHKRKAFKSFLRSCYSQPIKLQASFTSCKDDRSFRFWHVNRRLRKKEKERKTIDSM